MRNESKYGSTISKTIFFKFFITLAIYVAVIVVAFVASRTVFKQLTWQYGNPIYRLLNLVDDHGNEVIFLCSLIGFIAIFYYYWKKTFGFIDAVVEASESLIRQGDEPIELPNELNRVALHMNQAKQDSLRNLRLAREAEQRKNDLVMYLAHDIKTPLTSVIGYLSLLDEAPDMPSEQKAKYVNITLEKAYRLEKLVDEFFEITRYSFQMTTLSKENIDLNYMLAQMADEFYPLLSAKGKRADIHVPEGMTIYGDPDKLARVFNNVLKNAASYSPGNSIIDISAALSGDTVSITFTNAGNIPKDRLASIFDKFYRLDSSRSSDTGGAGLGLAIAKEIIASHDGHIFADSDDNQTTFTVELPTPTSQHQSRPVVLPLPSAAGTN